MDWSDNLYKFIKTFLMHHTNRCCGFQGKRFVYRISCPSLFHQPPTLLFYEVFLTIKKAEAAYPTVSPGPYFHFLVESGLFMFFCVLFWLCCSLLCVSSFYPVIFSFDFCSNLVFLIAIELIS